MKTKHYLSVAAVALALAACDDYDDTALWNQVNDNTSRIEALEQWQDEVNNNIAALQQLLNTNDMITSVTPVTLGGEVTGYTITFLHSDPITIYHGEKGEDGADGSTPQIGLTQQEDGNWYWTLNDELMTDAEGNPIRANGEDGTDGTDGKPGQPGTPAPTPQIKLGSSITSGTIETDNGTNDPNAWYLSVDNGKTWYRISGTDSTSGDSFFTKAPEVNEDKGTVTFYLKGGEPFTLPLYQGISISFTDIDDLNQPISIDGKKKIPYTVNGITDAKVTALPTADGWSATVSDETITVTAGSNAECDLLVTATDNAGNSVSYTLRLTPPYTVDGKGNYTVYTGKGLKAVADFINEDYRNNNDINIKLARDIDLTDVDWKIMYTEYQGTFDGQGHRITGLSIEETSGYATLFYAIDDNGAVKNLRLEDVNYTNTDDGYGSYGIATYNAGTITACSVTGKLTAPEHVAGITSYNTGTITACSVTGTLTASDEVVGIARENTGTITACWFNGTLTGPESYGIVYNCMTLSSVPNSGVISACYWGGNAEVGVYYQSPDATVEATKVNDGESWQSAIDGMNAALTGNDYEWDLGTDGLPVLKKK